MYPFGRPLMVVDREMSRRHCPKSTANGGYLCWDFGPRAGCTSRNGQRSMWMNERMSANGLHGSILTQLAQRVVTGEVEE